MNQSPRISRRQFFATAAAALATTSMASTPLMAHAPTPARHPMGVAQATFAIRWKSETHSVAYPGFQSALDVLDHCVRLGAGGAQVGVGDWPADFAGRVRVRRERLGLYLEGQIRLPREAGEVDRFDRDVAAAKEAGATLLRTACLGGRRYEDFESLADFEAFKRNAWQSLEWAETVLRRHRARLAVENHKDWRIDEMITLMEHLGSEWIGVTLDLGNNISLLEDPMEVVERLAPYTTTVHIKDMAVKPYEEGFLLSEVPLGDGVLDLPAMVAICERHNPAATFNLEMITRDPLQVPVLTDAYWATFDRVHGRELARSLRFVASHPPAQALPAVTGKNPEERLAFEEENNVRSFAYAREVLGMGA
jgi:3-oxoisoapionate decarboxylase